MQQSLKLVEAREKKLDAAISKGGGNTGEEVTAAVDERLKTREADPGRRKR